LANPELDVWVIDLQIMLFNNQIYGLTKGQYSPTSQVGKVTPSSPLGSIDQPVVPARFALGARATFVARAFDTSKNLPDALIAARHHKGAAFIEILQNCPVFNDGVFELITDRKTGPAYQLWLEHGQPMKFGANGEKGIRLRPETLSLEVVTIGEDGVTEQDLVVHDETNASLAWMLSDLPEVVALGVIYRHPGPVYNQSVKAQRELAEKRFGKADLHALLREGHTWTVS
jgi:2-oxoglutarate/2-oxoacid ferredoxin oxidoreductase subunit beta